MMQAMRKRAAYTGYAGQPNYYPTNGGFPNDLPLMRGEKVIEKNPDLRQLTTRYTEEALKFIERNRKEPFFLYLAHSMPHVPLGASYRFRGRSAGGRYGDVIEELDASVGAILDTLRRHNLDRKTLVLFTSDNGPWLSYGEHAGSAGPLREGKGTVWDGGVRVPCIARWPERIRAKSVIREPAMTIDLLPTLAKIVDSPLPPRPIDGKDMGSLLLGDPRAKSPQEAYFFYYNKNDLQAVRSGPWKLVLPHTYRTLGAGHQLALGGKPISYVSSPVTQPELYDLASDAGEFGNVALRHPDVVKRLLALADRIRADLGVGAKIGPGVRPAGKVE
jgi:arylsulfatase A